MIGVSTHVNLGGLRDRRSGHSSDLTLCGTGRPDPARLGHLFPRLLSQSQYNTGLRALAPLLEATLRWLAEATAGSAEPLRLMDATPVPCGQSVVTAKRSNLFGYAGYSYCPSHSRWYWGPVHT